MMKRFGAIKLIPPPVAVSDFAKIATGRSARKIEQEFPENGTRDGGQHFGGQGFFSTTNGSGIDAMINVYIIGSG